LALTVEEEWPDLQLWIIKLPQREIVRKIPLYSPEAKEALAAQEHNDCFSILHCVLFGVGHPSWAPNGRYLAFNSAPDQMNVDMFVYDTQRDILQRLTDEPHVEFVKEWSPDSKWIVYQEASECDCDGIRFDKISALTASEGVVHNLGATHGFHEQILGWSSADTFSVMSTHFEGPSDHLREVNVETGLVRFLYGGPFPDAALDPQSKTYILNISKLPCSSPWWVPEMEEGLYRFDEDTNEPIQIIPGCYWIVKWVPEINRFIAVDDEYHLLAFTSEGEVEFGFDARKLTPSPNGQWLLAHRNGGSVQAGIAVYHSHGEMVKPIGTAQNVLWLPDSTGFYRSSSGVLYLHTLGGDWQASVISEDVAGCGSLLIVRP
jgi:dipeptidyl aminopeptidase/acylaminoacyl peptidase